MAVTDRENGRLAEHVQSHLVQDTLTGIQVADEKATAVSPLNRYTFPLSGFQVSSPERGHLAGRDRIKLKAARMDEQSLAVTKWGDGARAGFQMLPDLLLKQQKALGLTAADLVVLINITLHWWRPKDNPFPRTTTIATRMGVDIRTVQRSLNRLEERGLSRRVKRSEGGVEYDLTGLVSKLQELAPCDPSFVYRQAARQMRHSADAANAV